jgi:drug/metabolite transporter (DMT)-like permease
MDPILWSNVRFFLAGIGMLIVTLLMRRKHPPLTKEFFLPLVPLSLLGMALGQGLFLFGLKKTTSINTAILTSTIPILTMLIVIMRRQEAININKLLGLSLAFVGVIIIRDISSFQLSNETFIGDMMVFLGALCFALYLCYAKKFLQQFDNFWLTTWMFLISGILMLIFNAKAWTEFEAPYMDSLFITSALYSIIGATLLTYLLNNWVLKKASSANVALFIYLQPVVAGVIGFLFLDESVTLRMCFSSLLILSGMYVSLSRKTP